VIDLKQLRIDIEETKLEATILTLNESQSITFKYSNICKNTVDENSGEEIVVNAAS